MENSRMFEVLASIDLVGGRVARLTRGDPRETRFYEKSPEEYAGLWSGAGFSMLHIVDIDAALGCGDNLDVIERILSRAGIPAQVGGGVRSLERAKMLIQLGAARVIISSIIFKQRDAALAILRELGGDRVVAALDFDEHGEVLIYGWRGGSGYKLVDALREISALGFERFMTTSTSRDGTLRGIDTTTLSTIPNEMRSQILAAGGIANVEDVLKLRDMGFGGAILGKAIYEGAISPEGLRRLGLLG
ncbi:MAG: 1-(5-phosphoribosyl)-5-[(5-phosphoribosylamino)methylideneamino] imidazole-4-carboxamide isomerase [Aigarchaeota archaeon]|nr:1-(5-phosphoribosyl)-5-[(5-phosphoribosylamino)methylideneamino] imidazole-4-carboxamide isomerase [Candidatus Pelearchaeum maunauluense]